MISRHSAHRALAHLLLIVALGVVGACSNTPTKRGLPWWPQGPGNPTQPEPTPATESKDEQLPTTAPSARPSAPSAPASMPAAAPAPSNRDTSTTAAPSNDPPATRYGDLLFLSGQTAMDEQNSSTVTGTVEQQTHAVMERIRTILESHRLTLANVVQVTVYLTDIDDLSAMDAVYQKHFRSNLPARSVIEVARLPRGARVQISAQAGR